MNKLAVMSVVTLAAACVFAQGAPMGSPTGAGPWVAQMLAGGDNLEKIGVEDEALRESLRRDLTSLKEKADVIEREVRKVSREQAKMMRELMRDRSRSADDVLAKIDEVAKLRAEQGRLAVQSIVLLRDKLSAEQLEAAHKLVTERGRARGRMRMEERGGNGRQFGPGARRGRGEQPPEMPEPPSEMPEPPMGPDALVEG